MTTREKANSFFATRPHRCQSGCLRASAFLRKKFWLADAGCYNPDSNLDSGEPSWHVYGKAIDLGCWWFDPSDKADGDKCWQYVLDHKEAFGLQQMIWGSKIVDVRDGYRVRRYNGGDHFNHIHIAFSYGASLNWRIPEVDDPDPVPVPVPVFQRRIMEAFYNDPRTKPLTTFYITANSRAAVGPTQLDLYEFAAGMAGYIIPHLGTLTKTQAEAFDKVPLVRA